MADHKHQKRAAENEERRHVSDSPFSGVHWLGLLSGSSAGGEDINEGA
jgi:hypothetical protein